MQQEINKENVVLLSAATPYSSPCIILSDEGAGWGIIDKFSIGDVLKSFTPYHLYIVDKEAPIGLNDWYIDDTNQVRQGITDHKEYWKTRQSYNKITASNNPALSEIPSISPEFIAKWVSVQGKEYKLIKINENPLEIIIECEK